MKGFDAFLAMAPDRVTEVIEDGPFPQAEYGGNGQKITARDKRMGIMRFKGGNGRGHLSTKSGQQGVVYYDPDFATEEYQFDDTPDSVLERHAEENVIAAFKKL